MASMFRLLWGCRVECTGYSGSVSVRDFKGNATPPITANLAAPETFRHQILKKKRSKPL